MKCSEMFNAHIVYIIFAFEIVTNVLAQLDCPLYLHILLLPA